MKPDAGKRMKTLPIGPLCPVCGGDGVVWSDKALDRWASETPWFDRGAMTPAPPNAWKDRKCERCQGAGMLNATTGEPLWDRLIPSAVPKDIRLQSAAKRRRGRGVRTR